MHRKRPPFVVLKVTFHGVKAYRLILREFYIKEYVKCVFLIPNSCVITKYGIMKMIFCLIF